MKIKYSILIASVLMAFFLAGCGCGGNDVVLVSIEVTPAESTIVQGATQQFTATGSFSDNTTKDITTLVTWSSSAPAIAGISNESPAQGLATGVHPGTVIITAASGNIQGTGSLTVIPELVSIAVIPDNQTINVGATQQFTAIGTYSDTTTADITSLVTWSVTAGAFAAISDATGSKGLATGVAAGVTTVIASSGPLSGSAILTVVAPPPPPPPSVVLLSIQVTPANPIVKFDTKIQFTATGAFSDGSRQNITQTVTWSSSNVIVATISNDPGSKGIATTDHKLGNSIITATSGNISGWTTLIDP